MRYVYCAVGTEALQTVQVTSSLEGVNSIQNKRFTVSITLQYSELIFTFVLLLWEGKASKPFKDIGENWREKYFHTEKFVTSLPCMKENADLIATDLVLCTALFDNMYGQLLDRTGQLIN